jgi:hypothetical protein
MSAPIYPLERAAEVMPVFRDYLAQASDDLMGLGVFWSAPQAPEVPRQWHGAPVVILMSCYSGPFEKGEAAIAPLRRIGGAIADLSGPMRWSDLQKFLDADYPDGAFYYWKSIYLDRLDDEVIRELSTHNAARPSHLSSIDVWTLGRAMERVKPSETAFYKRDAPYLIGIEANWQNHADADANIAWARSVFEDLQPFTRGGNYLNFPGFFEDQDGRCGGPTGPTWSACGPSKPRSTRETASPGRSPSRRRAEAFRAGVLRAQPAFDILLGGNFTHAFHLAVHHHRRRTEHPVAGDFHEVGDLFHRGRHPRLGHGLLHDFFGLLALGAAGPQYFDIHADLSFHFGLGVLHSIQRRPCRGRMLARRFVSNLKMQI